MSYFRSFPTVAYVYGDGNSISLTDNLAAYAEIIDTVKDNTSFYQDYYIQIGERPDHAAYTLYKNPLLHWTFFLMNPKLRERGWPELQHKVLEKVKLDYPNIVLTTRDEIFDTFKVGQEVTGQTSLATGVVVSKNLDLGQVVIKTILGTFDPTGEQVNSVVGLDIEILHTVSVGPEYLSAKHYTVDGEQVSINPYIGPSITDYEVTHYEHYISENDELKQIRALKPSTIRSISRAFADSLES